MFPRWSLALPNRLIIKTLGYPRNAPPVILPATFTVEEGATIGTIVGTVTASDPEGKPLTFTITAGNDAGTFTIDADTGEITAAATVPAYSTTPSYSLTVEASDGSAFATATINIVVLYVSFNQSIGAELLTNGDFSLWSGGNPSSWTVVESPPNREVSETGSGQPKGGGGTGAANVYSNGSGSISLNQAAIVAGSFYHIQMVVSYLAGTGSRLFLGNSSTLLFNYANANNKSIVARNNTAGNQIFPASHVTASEVTLDSVSVKLVTPNTQQVAPLNATHEVQFTLPVSELAGQRIALHYRIVDNANCWIAYLQRNDANTAWDFRLESVVSGTPTNRKTVTGQTGEIDAIRVVTNGNDHTCYLGEAGIYTQLGAIVTNATHNTATGINVIYNPEITPLNLRSAA